MPPNLLIITVDTLRPDALGWVSGRSSTPAMDRLAGGGFRFPRAVSPVPLTLPAHVSLMTGLNPPRHGVRDNGQVLGGAPLLLAERLAERGYHTAAFVSAFPLNAQFGLARGFTTYDDHTTAGAGAWLERSAGETNVQALEWLKGRHGPWFVWVHYYEPHFPYAPPRGVKVPDDRGGYDGEVAVVDRAVAELLAGVERMHPQPRLTVFAGDHGESLGEHGEGTHGFFIYDSTVRVPMVFHFPGVLEAGESREAVGLVDVAPTVCELLQLEAWETADGGSLLRLMRGKGGGEVGAVYLESRQPWLSYGWAPLEGVIRGGFKLIAAPRPELYDLHRDPLEQRNLANERATTVAELRNELAGLRSSAAPVGERVVDAETAAALAALGYVGGVTGEDEPTGALIDPKDRIAMRETLTAADERLAEGDFRGAGRIFDSVLETEPGNVFALTRGGEAWLRAGDSYTAVARYEALVRVQPERAAGWSNLGAALGRAGRAADAVAAYRRAAALEPEVPFRLVRLAFAEHAAGEVGSAVRHLIEADEEMGPEDFPHAGALGLLLVEQERFGKARAYLERCRPSEAEYAPAKLALARLLVAAGDRSAAREALHMAGAVDPQVIEHAKQDPILAPLINQ